MTIEKVAAMQMFKCDDCLLLAWISRKFALIWSEKVHIVSLGSSSNEYIWPQIDAARTQRKPNSKHVSDRKWLLANATNEL